MDDLPAAGSIFVMVRFNGRGPSMTVLFQALPRAGDCVEFASERDDRKTWVVDRVVHSVCDTGEQRDPFAIPVLMVSPAFA